MITKTLENTHYYHEMTGKSKKVARDEFRKKVNYISEYCYEGIERKYIKLMSDIGIMVDNDKFWISVMHPMRYRKHNVLESGHSEYRKSDNAVLFCALVNMTKPLNMKKIDVKWKERYDRLHHVKDKMADMMKCKRNHLRIVATSNGTSDTDNDREFFSLSQIIVSGGFYFRLEKREQDKKECLKIKREFESTFEDVCAEIAQEMFRECSIRRLELISDEYVERMLRTDFVDVKFTKDGLY